MTRLSCHSVPSPESGKSRGLFSRTHSCLSTLVLFVLFCFLVSVFFLNDMFSSGRWEQALKNNFFLEADKLAAWKCMCLGARRRSARAGSAPAHLVPLPSSLPTILHGPSLSPAHPVLWILLVLLCTCCIKLPHQVIFTKMNVLTSPLPAAEIQLICKQQQGHGPWLIRAAALGMRGGQENPFPSLTAARTGMQG